MFVSQSPAAADPLSLTANWVAPAVEPEALLGVRNLSVEFRTSRGTLRAVENISYDVRRGEILALVGESGCGKSVSSLAVMRLLPKRTSRILSGSITFEGRDLLKLSDEEMRDIRGRDIAMIFQEPMTSLNPVLTIGFQIMESLFVHLRMSKEKAKARAVELLGLVGITDPERRLQQYPHQLSGGMRQRVMIALALACEPKLIIADEPTTALDVTIQAQILELLRDLSERLNIAVILITHNLGIVARYAHRVNVMYAARLAETGTAADVFLSPKHPYTMGLMRSVPRLDRPRGAKLPTIEGLPPDLRTPPEGCRFAARCAIRAGVCSNAPMLSEQEPGHHSACWRAREIENFVSILANGTGGEAPKSGMDLHGGGEVLKVEGLKKFFRVSGGIQVRAVNDVSFTLRKGETLGLVGESGCGKTTVGRAVLRLDEPTEGRILFAGTDIAHLKGAGMRAVRRQMQVVFQDPFSSLNPRMTVAKILAEPLLVHGIVKSKREARARVDELLHQVGLHSFMADRYPHEMSGGQRQRVGIARALAMNPSVIICDEPVSALDVSIQGQIINLLEDLQRTLGLTYLFIAHDLAVVRHISDRVMVMYLGRVMEVADRDTLYAQPLHPYTQALLDAAPVPDPLVERSRQPRALEGELPSPLKPPSGCVFRTRCPIATKECAESVPQARDVRPGHIVACHKVI